MIVGGVGAWRRKDALHKIKKSRDDVSVGNLSEILSIIGSLN